MNPLHRIVPLVQPAPRWFILVLGVALLLFAGFNGVTAGRNWLVARPQMLSLVQNGQTAPATVSHAYRASIRGVPVTSETRCRSCSNHADVSWTLPDGSTREAKGLVLSYASSRLPAIESRLRNAAPGANTADPIIVYVEGNAAIEPVFLADKETMQRRYGLLAILLQLGFAALNASIGALLLLARVRA